MATGPEHYREAERLNDRAYHYIYGDGADVETGVAFAAMAQVHATLAAAAATALGTDAWIDDGGAERGMPVLDTAAWYDAAGTKHQPAPGVL